MIESIKGVDARACENGVDCSSHGPVGRFPGVTGHRPVATKVVNRARIDIMQTAENEPGRRGRLSVNFFNATSVSALPAASANATPKLLSRTPRRAGEL